jgi:hypothetical protein
VRGLSGIGRGAAFPFDGPVGHELRVADGQIVADVVIIETSEPQAAEQR